MKKVISTAIAYANAGPHIGHAFEYVLADTISRYLKNKEGIDNVFFVTGMDEHGQKIEQKAKEMNIPLQDFVDTNANLFKNLDIELGINYDYFVRTSDKEAHYKGAQLLWNKLLDAGTLEKREYSALYCIGCEEFKMEKDLSEKGECIVHLKAPEEVKEENWFFKLSKYGKEIQQKIESDELKIHPETRKNEIMALLERGLEDVSFSRPKEKVSWGIPVPGDDSQVMYVWCDALSNYITALGYGKDKWEEGKEFWNDATHIIGKDILRFHGAIWPGMLMAAGLPLPKNILVHGFITSGGQKMSKSLGNVISPNEILDLFRPACGDLAGEALRFVLLHEIPSFEDGDLTMEGIKASYTAHLANGIGNLTSRIMKMATSYEVTFNPKTDPMNIFGLYDSMKDISRIIHLEDFDTKEALSEIMSTARSIDGLIQLEQPFKLIKIDEKRGKEIIKDLLVYLYKDIALPLHPFMPKTSAKILECIRENKMPEKPLFNRLA